MRRSVAVNERDWQAEPSFSHQEHEVEKKDGETLDHTYTVILLDGSPYERLIAENGRALCLRSSARNWRRKRKKVRAAARRVRPNAAGASKSIARIANTTIC